MYFCLCTLDWIFIGQLLVSEKKKKVKGKTPRSPEFATLFPSGPQATIKQVPSGPNQPTIKQVVNPFYSHTHTHIHFTQRPTLAKILESQTHIYRNTCTHTRILCANHNTLVCGTDCVAPTQHVSVGMPSVCGSSITSHTSGVC